MSVSDDHRTFGRTRLGFADAEEVNAFVTTLSRFEHGEIGPDEWRAFRLVHGVYGQAQDGANMVRVKIPQGIATASQLRALASVARRYSRGFCHITTRQNIQFHFVHSGGVEAAMTALSDAGLTTREACGNSVRNITACPYSGVAKDEVFDVTPYAEAMTRFLLRHPLSSALPRKFKIAWEGCSTDHAILGIHDIGLRALTIGSNGTCRRGFRVTVGGGTAVLCRSGATLVDFLPAAQVLEVALAIVRVFHVHGDYQHRHRNRLKFLVAALGWERFRDEVHKEWERVRIHGAPELPFDPEYPPVESAPLGERGAPPSTEAIAEQVRAEQLCGPGIAPAVRPVLGDDEGGYLRWVRTNVTSQKQAGFVVATVTVPLGDLTAGQLETVADLALAYADGTVRTTSEQNLLLRWVPERELRALYRRLGAAGFRFADAESVSDVVCCPGAESCRLAVTHSRGLGRLLRDELLGRDDLVQLDPDLRLRVSGCPNGCGRHHIADIGFQGSVRKLGDRAVPQYFVLLGGGVENGDGHARFGRQVAKVPARRIPQVVERLLALYASEKMSGESARDFFRRLETARASTLLADLAAISAEDAVPDDYVDLGGEDDADRTGDCGAVQPNESSVLGA